MGGRPHVRLAFTFCRNDHLTLYQSNLNLWNTQVQYIHLRLLPQTRVSQDSAGAAKRGRPSTRCDTPDQRKAGSTV